MSAPSHRPRRTAFASLVAAVAIAALPALADARPIVDHGMPAIPVNAPGTDVAAVDQQAPIADNPSPVSPADGPDDSLPTLVVLALIALGLTVAGLGLASRHAATRRRTRAAA